MKKYLLLLLALSWLVLAATDTDGDGVSDEKDICPRVYARSTTGCPTLAASWVSVALNSCLQAQVKSGKTIAVITPVCDGSTKTCPKITNVLGVQSCDPIFPVIFDSSGFILVRGAIYIIDYTK